MKRLIPVLVLAISAFATDSAAPDWASHTFKASPNVVFNAAAKAIASHHEIKSKDADLKVIRFHVGTTAWSWGYTMICTIEKQTDGSSIAKMAIEKSGGPVMSWGSGKKEVGKIFKWTEENLSKGN